MPLGYETIENGVILPERIYCDGVLRGGVVDVYGNFIEISSPTSLADEDGIPGWGSWGGIIDIEHL